jgi:hypothetical protein
MKIGDRQTERISQPVIGLTRKNFKLSDDELLQPQRYAELFFPVRMRNVGTGAALDVHWRFKKDSGTEIINGMIPQLQPNQI